MTQHSIKTLATNPSERPWHVLWRFCAMLLAQVLGGVLATFVTTGFARAAVLLVVVPLVTSLLCASSRIRSKLCILLVAAATASTFAGFHLLRCSFEPAWFLGSVPAGADHLAFGAMTIVTVLCAGCACLFFSSRGMLGRFRWVSLGVMAMLLCTLAVVAQRRLDEPSPTGLLRTLVALEQHETADPSTQQILSTMLAMCGRDTEAESRAKWIVDGGGTVPPARPIDISTLEPRPWREAFTEIAQRERLIIVMEAHDAPRHRQWIEQTLLILSAAGFRDYAAEGLQEPGWSLKKRGYPTRFTGYYVSDPHFGNVLRTAIELDFNLHAYESSGSNFAQREYEQAAKLAKLFSTNPNLKLVVHAGYAHVLKKPRNNGETLMAAHLWKMTGIEPYCILQTWHSPEEREARQLAALTNTDSEPVMLVPAPSGLNDPQFGFPTGAVDALVVHPASVGGPAQRVHSFKNACRRVSGAWHGSEWPVVIGAFKTGEPADAIARDQVMLRQGESHFVLWVPQKDYEIRAFGLKGQVNSTNPDGSPVWELRN